MDNVEFFTQTEEDRITRGVTGLRGAVVFRYTYDPDGYRITKAGPIELHSGDPMTPDQKLGPCQVLTTYAGCFFSTLDEDGAQLQQQVNDGQGNHMLIWDRLQRIYHEKLPSLKSIPPKTMDDLKQKFDEALRKPQSSFTLPTFTLQPKTTTMRCTVQVDRKTYRESYEMAIRAAKKFFGCYESERFTIDHDSCFFMSQWKSPSDDGWTGSMVVVYEPNLLIRRMDEG